MGLHTGEAEQRGGDYYGPALNRAARLMAVAHGGQTLLSTTTADLVRDQLPASSRRCATWVSTASRTLSGRSTSTSSITRACPRSSLRFARSMPSPTICPSRSPASSVANIELEQARERLATAHLLTLIGPGGTGKTRLSLQLAAEMLHAVSRMASGSSNLAPITDPALVAAHRRRRVSVCASRWACRCTSC